MRGPSGGKASPKSGLWSEEAKPSYRLPDPWDSIFSRRAAPLGFAVALFGRVLGRAGGRVERRCREPSVPPNPMMGVYCWVQLTLSGGVLEHWMLSVMPEEMGAQATSVAVRVASSRVGAEAVEQFCLPL